MMECLEGIDGIAVVADDVLLYGEGTTIQEAQQDHDKKL